MEMSKFKNYEALYAEQGDFDIPANWTVGVAIKPVESFTVAFDVQQIYYSKTESIGNTLLPNLMTARLGDDGGAGFGWEGGRAYKLGLQWGAQRARSPSRVPTPARSRASRRSRSRWISVSSTSGCRLASASAPEARVRSRG